MQKERATLSPGAYAIALQCTHTVYKLCDARAPVAWRALQKGLR